MHALLTLFLVAVPQGDAGPLHSNLHPADADLYFEVPDVPALLDQYEAVPMVRAFRDDSVRGFLGDLGVNFSLDPQALVSSLMSATLAGADPGDLIKTTRSFSASFGVGEDRNPALNGVVDFLTDAGAAEAFTWMKNSASALGEGSTAGFQEMKFAQMPGTSFWAKLEGTRLVYCGGASTPETVSQRSADTSLAAQQDLSGALGSMASASGVTLAWVGLRRSPLDVVADLPESMTQDIVPVIEGLRSSPIPLGFLERQRWIRMNLEGGRFLTEMVTQGAPSTESSPSPVVKEEWLTTVPDEAMFLYASGFDGAGMAGSLRSLMSIEPGAAQTLAKVEDDLGLSIDGLFAKLGPNLVTYAFPIAGIGVPQMYVWTDLEGGEGFQENVEALMNRLGEVVPGLKAKSRAYKVKTPDGERRAFPITTINLPPEIGQIGGFLSVAPAFAVVEDRVVFSLTSLHVKRELKRLFGPDVGTTDAFANRGLTFPKDPQSVMVMDWGKLVSGLFELARAAGAMLGDNLPFQMSDLPDPEVFTRELRPTMHFTRATDAGSYRRMESSFGPEFVLGLMGLDTAQEPVEELPPPAERQAELEQAEALQERLEVTKNGFRVLRGGLTIYRLEHQGFPASLEELTQPTDSFPQGFVDGSDVPRDGWDRDFRYRTEGKGYVLYSVGPNGVDEAGQGDDLRP